MDTIAVDIFGQAAMKNTGMAITGSKVAAVTFAFWVMKIAATTLGETAGDLLSMTLNLGYAVSSAVLVAAFIALLLLQLSARRFHPVLFWSVVLATSTAGTTISDLLDRTLGLGYALGSSLLAICLVIILLVWRKSEGSISVSHIGSRRTEIFYWSAVLFSNTLGTALGDFLADDSGLGFAGGATLVGTLILATALATRIRGVSRVMLFWIAFVLTRPFGATFGDVLTKPLEKGGLDFGTIGSSLILFSILACLVIFSPVPAPDGARALTGLVASAARTRGDTATTAYPRLFRIFTGSIAVAVLCGFTAVAIEGSKSLHPAPFLALAALCVITATFSFASMLICLLAEFIQFLRRR